VHHVEKILFAFFLIYTSVNYAQDSTSADFISPNYSAVSGIKNSTHLPLSLYDKVLYATENINPHTASQPVFINSERPLIDGTSWRKYSDVDFLRLSSMIVVMGTANVVAYMYQRKVWYTRETSAFHTLDFAFDWKKYQQMDKYGHFADAYFTSDLAGKIYRWSGFSGNTSVWLGAVSGWFWMLEIEVSDGFMADWGFSWGDMLANTLGSGFYVLQQFNYDLLGGIHPKFSWHKSDSWKQNKYNPGALIEDYEGMTFWVTLNPHHYFPESWKDSYPQWLAPLGLAFGVGAKGIANDVFGGYQEYYLGLDIDLRKLPVLDDTNFLKFLKSEVNFLRMPLPTIRFSPNGTWFGFYF
jgi:hypothetical protein